MMCIMHVQEGNRTNLMQCDCATIKGPGNLRVHTACMDHVLQFSYDQLVLELPLIVMQIKHCFF